MLNKKKWRRFISAKLLIASMILGGAAMKASGAWGDLDTSFVSGGTYQETATGYQIGDVVMQPDGKILVTGSKLNSNGKKRFFLRRSLSNGTPDASFGSNGSAVINVLLNSNYDYGGIEVRMLTASKIIVLGHSNNNIAVWMVNGDGYGNANFGTNGMKVLSNYTSVRTHLGSISSRPVIGLYDETSQRVIIIKLNVDGTPDTTFGTFGKVNTNIYGTPTQTPSFEMITEADTTKITVGGMSLDSNPAIIKLERRFGDGTIDKIFFPLSNGSVEYPITIFNGFYKLNSSKYVYSHFNADGVNFTGFLSRTSSLGVLEERIIGGPANMIVGIQPDGKIVVEGAYGVGRYDEDINAQGSFSLYPNIEQLYARRYTFQADNKMIVVGTENDKLTLVRLLAN